MSERLAGLLSRPTGGRGHHRIKLSDLAQLSTLGDLTSELGTLSEQLKEHLGQLSQLGGLGGLGGLGVRSVDESTEEGRLQKAIVTGDVDRVKELCRANSALVSSTPLFPA